MKVEGLVDPNTNDLCMLWLNAHLFLCPDLLDVGVLLTHILSD